MDRDPGRSYNWGQTVCQGLGEGSQSGQGRDEGGRGELGSGDGRGAETSSPGGPLPMERHPTFNPVMGAATGMAELRSPVCPGTCLSAVWPQQAQEGDEGWGHTRTSLNALKSVDFIWKAKEE